MTKRLIPSCLAAVVALSAGCMHSKKPKENTSITGETEDTLKQRWIDKRTTELVAQGVTAEAARAQATTEFKAKYSFTGAAQK